jgi:hypothetical protein
MSLRTLSFLIILLIVAIFLIDGKNDRKKAESRRLDVAHDAICEGWGFKKGSSAFTNCSLCMSTHSLFDYAQDAIGCNPPACVRGKMNCKEVGEEASRLNDQPK